MDRYPELHANFRWLVPARFNIAQHCCTRWSADRSRLALLWEDESGAQSQHTYWEVQQQANRLSNALAALGVVRGDRVAIVMPQRPETAIAYMAVFQMGAVALPLSHLFGPEALAYRLENAQAKVAIVEPTTLPTLLAARHGLSHLQQVIGVAGALDNGVHDWARLLDQASSRFNPVDTAAEDPALIIYTSGTTGAPKGALQAHRSILGNLSGFSHSHDFFPQPGDRFWSPADWAWTGGLFDALLPTWAYGQTILGYRGKFDPEHAFDLMQRHHIRNSFLFPTALKLMMKTVPEPRRTHSLRLRTIMSAGESLGVPVLEWAREQLGVTINEMFGQTEINYVVGNCQSAWPVKPGSIGRGYPGHRVAVLGPDGQELARGELGDIAVNRLDVHGAPDPVFFLNYWGNPTATADKFSGDWGLTGDQGHMDEDGYLWYQGRNDDVIKSAGYRIGPGEIESCLLRHPAVAMAAVIGKPDATRGAVIKAFIVLQPDQLPSKDLEAAIRLHVRERLAPYEYPREIEFIDVLPMTTTGKVQRNLLRQRETGTPH